MAKRHNHYEAAFEDYLRGELAPYVAVDERRRSLAPAGTLKSVDFVLSLADGPTRRQLLVDVKGRKFPSGIKQPQYWRNWTTRDEIESLARWTDCFGPGCEAALVFAYLLVGERSPVSPERVHYFRDQPYAFVAASLDEYRAAARTLSPRWGTVSVRVADFRRMARPIHDLLSAEHAC